MINLTKYNYLELEVKMLGNMVGNGLVKPCYKKLQDIAKCKKP